MNMSDNLEVKYWGSFLVCCCICFILQVLSRNGSNEQKIQTLSSNPKFITFQRTYLSVYLLAMLSDWLQGPYVYELYVSYGFSKVQIAELFVCGFASSMICGTFVGGLADKLGRKSMCLLYCFCYMGACMTKAVPDYYVLMFGRFLCGISTSLLFSVFESWMVCEHHKQGFDASLLSDTFAYATFGNGVVAVIAGLLANTLAKSYGFVAPFLTAIIPLILVFTMINLSWNENYGNQSTPLFTSLIRGFELLRNDSRIFALGLSQSCFEGAMYTFVFMWTPALKSLEDENRINKTLMEHLIIGNNSTYSTMNIIDSSNTDTNSAVPLKSTSDYLGLIFAVYMVCVMIGSTLFKLISVSKDYLYKLPLFIHAIASLSMIITAFTVGTNSTVVYIMFLIFETTVGCFYPVYGCIKSEKIPEEIRSAVMNIFRLLDSA